MTDAIEQFLEEVPVLERVIPIAHTVYIDGGGRTVVCSLELWSNGVVIRDADVAQGRPEAQLDSPLNYFQVSDDLGTEYQMRGSGSGGGENMRLGQTTFKPAVSDGAKVLRITVPRCDGPPLEVSLA